jgi:Autotransporter beta-domain
MLTAAQTSRNAGQTKFTSRRCTSLASASVIVLLLAPSDAIAACTDTFSSGFVSAGAPSGTIGFAYQNLFPLGVGASLNAVVSTMNTLNTAFLSPSSSFVSARSDAHAGQLGGGVWSRAVGGTVESKTTTTSTVDTSKAKTSDFVTGAAVPLAPITGTGTCKGTLKEDYFGYQFGFDLANLNIGNNGGNFHFGLTAGYLGSRTKDITKEDTFFKAVGASSGFLDSPAGSLRTESQVPFLGLYAAYTQGNFFIDGQVRHDLYLMTMSDPLNGLSNQAQNAYGMSAGGNVGYRFALPLNWFFEPSGGVMWSRVHVDPIPTSGSSVFQFQNAGSVKIDDIESILGRFSVRVGTTISGGALTWQPFVTGTVFHEFAGEATAKSTVGGPEKVPCVVPGPVTCPAGFLYNTFHDQTLKTSTSRIGTFGQVGVGTVTAFGNSGWLAYGRGDYKFGESVEGYSVNLGLRYHW